MTQNFINEMLIVAAGWLVLCIPVWLVLWLVFPRMDRRPKDSIRCRACWYDLRANTSDQCPECGADLVKTGVWPVGKPNRSKPIHLSMIWFWMSTVTTIIVTGLYSDYRNDILKHYTIEQEIAIVVKPKSETHDGVAIALIGQGWELFPGELEDMTIRPESVSIRVISAGVLVQSVTVDPQSMTFTPHPLPYGERAQEAVRDTNHSTIQPGQQVTPETLADFYPLGLDDEKDRLLLAEMAFVIEAAKTCSAGGPLLRVQEETYDTADELRANVERDGEYSIVKAMSDIYDYKSRASPMWITFTILGVGVILIALGVLKIRKWCYRRDTAVWKPHHIESTL